MILSTAVCASMMVALGVLASQEAAPGRENGFKCYRFKVDKVGASPDGGLERMQFSELRLYDIHETDITDRHVRAYCGSRDYEPGEPWQLAVDGIREGRNKWCDMSPMRGHISNLWLRLDFPEPVKVAYYAWWTANDAGSKMHWRDPVSWRMQGSADGGRTWVDLDMRTDYDVPTNRCARVGPFGCPPLAAQPVDAVDPFMGTGADMRDRQGLGATVKGSYRDKRTDTKMRTVKGR
jgi:hypothetical protein